MTAVAPGGSPFGNELFAAEGHAAVAAVAGLDTNSRFVNEHYSVSSVLGRGVHCRYIKTTAWRTDRLSMTAVTRWFRKSNQRKIVRKCNRLFIAVCDSFKKEKKVAET